MTEHYCSKHINRWLDTFDTWFAAQQQKQNACVLLGLALCSCLLSSQLSKPETIWKEKGRSQRTALHKFISLVPPQTEIHMDCADLLPFVTSQIKRIFITIPHVSLCTAAFNTTDISLDAFSLKGNNIICKKYLDFIDWSKNIYRVFIHKSINLFYTHFEFNGKKAHCKWKIRNA